MMLDNKKLVTLLEQKDVLVKEGRKISMQLELMEKDRIDFETKEKEITLKVEPKILITRGNAIKADIEKKLKLLEDLGHEIEDLKLAAVPKEMKDAHLALLKKKEALERERNKLALKIQKIKDVLIPIVKRDVGPLLKKYEDIETATIQNGQVKITTFSYFDEFKRNFELRK